MVVPHHPEYEKLKKIELSRDAWRDLAQYALERYPDMQTIACVYELGSVEFCEAINIDAYKLHSSDLSNVKLLEAVARTEKRIDLSIGASNLNEIQMAIERINETSDSEVWLMYGHQNFPTPIQDIHLSLLMKLKNLFELPVGYQDHSDAETPEKFIVPAAAIGMGVDIIEKHITHDRTLKGIDHESALDLREFLEFVRMVRTIEEAMGISIPKPFTNGELKYRKDTKKSIVASKDLPQGIIISEDDLMFMRAERYGLPPDQSNRLINRKIKHSVKQYQLFNEEDVE